MISLAFFIILPFFLDQAVQATTDEAAIEEEHSSLLAAIDKAAWQTRMLVTLVVRKAKTLDFGRAPLLVYIYIYVHQVRKAWVCTDHF